MTIEEIQARKESQTFDCKSIQIDPKIAQYLKAYKYVKEFGEGIDRICNELETKGCAIPSFHADAFILKATLMAEWTSENEFDRPSAAQVEKLISAIFLNNSFSNK